MDRTSKSSQSSPIVVGLDGSENSLRAFEIAVEFARTRSQSILIISAYTENSFGKKLGDRQEKIRHEVESLINRVVTSVAVTDLEISSASYRGNAVEALVSASKDASLVVVGKRGRSRFAGRLLGSVSSAVAAHSHSPTLVVPEEQAGLPELQFAELHEGLDLSGTELLAHETIQSLEDFKDAVVVGIDLEAEVQPLVMQGATYAKEHNLRLVIISAHPLSTDMWVPLSTLHRARLPEIQNTMANKMTEIAREVSEKTGVPVEWGVFDAYPADILSKASSTASLVLLGTRGHGGFAGLVLGSVSQAVLNRTISPVLVVPPEGQRAL